jgi:hypothetical protein
MAAIIGVALPSLVIALWLAPRAAPPPFAPALTIPDAEVRADAAEERALAARAPEATLEPRRRELYLAQSRAELDPDLRQRVQERAERLAAAIRGIEEERGVEAVIAIRARDVERMMAALAGEGSDEQRAGELGALPASLERWGAIDGRRRIASELVIRTLAAARWNVMHGRAPTADLSAARLRAYHGWLALHGDAAGPELRASAIDRYERSGGADADEMRGLLAWGAGEGDAARAAFERAYVLHGTIRFRNHALAAAEAAASQ